MEPTAPQSTVFFDGSCELCRAETWHYRRKDHVGALCFIDISEPQVAPPEGITHQQAMRRFHVRAGDGRVLLRRGRTCRGLVSVAQVALGRAHRVPAGSPDCPGDGLRDFSFRPTIPLEPLWPRSAASGHYRRRQAQVTDQFGSEAR